MPGYNLLWSSIGKWSTYRLLCSHVSVGLIFPGLHRGQVLISRAILVFHLDILAPLSKVDENMRRAHEVDATRRKEFFFLSGPPWKAPCFFRAEIYAAWNLLIG